MKYIFCMVHALCFMQVVDGKTSGDDAVSRVTSHTVTTASWL